MSTVTRRVAASPDQITAADERFQRLVRQALQRYLRARAAITPELTANIKRLSHSWCKGV